MYRFATALLGGFLLLVSCSLPRQEATEVAKSDLTDEAVEWVDSVMDTMSLRQKAAQVLMPGIYAESDEWTLSQFVKYAATDRVGGIVLLEGDTASVLAMADTLRKLSPIPVWLAIDAEWGLGMRLHDAPTYPANGRLPAGVGESEMYDYGREIAEQCRRLGINMLFGPVVDVVDDPARSYIGYRSFGSDPERVASLASAYSRGATDGAVITVAKHFPGHGSAADSHKTTPVITRSLHDLTESDLVPFKRLVDEGVKAVMVGHLAVPAIDPDMRPAAVSQIVIEELLRNDLRFDGLVITDALNMKGAEGYDAVDALKAGADIIIAPRDTEGQIDAITKAVETGNLDKGVLDGHVRRILLHKYLLLMQ